MTLKLDRLAFLFVSGIAGFAAVGCGGKGGQAYNDGSIVFDAKPDGTSTDTGAQPDGGTPSDGADEVQPDPVAGDGSRLVFAGTAVSLVGSGDDSCTNQVPYSTDRWCAFTKPATSLGNNELWVINATQAAAGTVIKCNTTDPNCLRLTSGLLNDSQFRFRIHRFDGDTLIFSEGVGGGPSGDIFAWRPGWTAPRKLTSQNGELCMGNKSSASVLCIDNVMVDAAMTKRTLDLRAGTIDSQVGGLVPLVDSFIYATATDSQTDLQHYEWDISPDGRYIAWSGRYDVTGLETLKVQKVDDATSRVTVAEDVSAWTISEDGAKWYWLKTFNYNGSGAGSGSLESAPFPAGTPSKALAAKVGDYFQAGKSKGLLLHTNLTAGAGALSLMPDREAPGTIQALDTKVLGIFDVSADGTKVMYTKTEDLLGGVLPVFDLFVAKADGSPVCTLSTSAAAFADPTGPKFLTSGALAVFGRIDEVTGEGEGLYVDIAMCKATKFATEIYAWQPIADEGFVYSDGLTAVNQKGETTLRFGKVTNGGLPVPGTAVQTRTSLQFAPLLPALDSVMYTISAGTTVDGLYINTKLPFTTVGPVPAPDGGVSMGGDAGTDAAGDTAGSSDASDAAASTDSAGDTAASSDAGSDAVSSDATGGVDATVDLGAADL